MRALLMILICSVPLVAQQAGAPLVTNQDLLAGLHLRLRPLDVHDKGFRHVEQHRIGEEHRALLVHLHLQWSGSVPFAAQFEADILRRLHRAAALEEAVARGVGLA